MADSSSQQPSLTVLGGPMAGQRLVLDEAVANLLIGSDPSCDFYLPHDSVSPIHARLWVDLEGAVLHETSSPHGVYVNDERVAGKRPLHNGDIVWLGPPGGADVVMIQCVLAEAAEAEPAADQAPAADDVAEREALESLAPTLAARPALADMDDGPGRAEPPAWDPDPPPISEAKPAAADAEDARTQAFRVPADFAAALAAAKPAPADQSPAAATPPATGQPDELEHLFSEHVGEPAPPLVATPPVEPMPDPHAYATDGEPMLVDPEPTIVEPEPAFTEPEPEPVLADHEPMLAEVDPYVAEQAYAADPEPEIVEPMLPEPEATHTFAASAPLQPLAAAPAAAGDLPSDFDDMMFSVPEEPVAPPAAAPAVHAAAPAPSEETVLLPSPPRATVAAAPPATPPPPAPPPRAPAAQATAAKPPNASAAPAPQPAAAVKAASAPARPMRPAAPGSGTVPPRSTPPRAPREAEGAGRPGSKAIPVAALAGAGVLAVAVLAGGYWVFGRSEPAQTAVTEPPLPTTLAMSPVTAPAAMPTPELVTEPVPEPSPEFPPAVAPGEDVVTIVRTATPPPRPAAAPNAPAATPRPAETRRPDPVDPAAATRARIAAAVTGLLGQAQAAVSARSYDTALTHFDAVLKLDPQNATAQNGKTAATAARAHARKAFVAGRTMVQTEKSRGGGLAGFESSGVNVQKAPDFLGRVEYAMTPASVQPGDPWELKIYVVNEGKKAIKISALSVATVVNGSPAASGGSPRNREVAPQQRVIVDQLSGTWPPGVTSWRTDVKITAGKNETLQSQLTWR